MKRKSFMESSLVFIGVFEADAVSVFASSTTAVALTSKTMDLTVKVIAGSAYWCRIKGRLSVKSAETR